MIKKRFFLDRMCAGFRSIEEVVEFDDDATEQDIRESFDEWVFDQLDTAILDEE